jgi:hypothetical protein
MDAIIVEQVTQPIDQRLETLVDRFLSACRPRRVGIPKNLPKLAQHPPGSHPKTRPAGVSQYAFCPPSWNVLVYAEQESQRRIALRCVSCNGLGTGLCRPGLPPGICQYCAGHGAFGIEAALPTICSQGSEGKVAILAARYQDGLPLFHPLDRIGNTKSEELHLRMADLVALTSDDEESS